MYKLNYILSQIGWNHTIKPLYKTRLERLYYFREKFLVCLTLAVHVLGYQVQTFLQFLNYIRLSISGYVWSDDKSHQI